jgi:hypothetical protein
MSLEDTKPNIVLRGTVIGIRPIGFLPLLRRLVKCKVCNKMATCCFTTSGGGFVLFCKPCFETFNIFYKREIKLREELGIILEEELENYV